MGHSNGVITAPVNTDDVSSTLGVASHDVATLCTHERVRKWNKNKPYRGVNPDVYSRDTDNATNQTGKYLGSRGAATGFPVYWGMRYPMNTAQQNSSGTGRTTLLELCYDVAVQQGYDNTSGRSHPNYEYMKPEIGTDFCRLDDFDGYHQNGEAFLKSGVAGAVPGQSKPAELTTNVYDQPNLTIYASIPPDSVGWGFKDLIPGPETYYLVAEIYKNDTANVWKRASAGTPVKTVRSAVTLADAGMSISIEVPLSEIKTALGIADSTTFTFWVCVGFNKYSGSNPVASSAFVSPWMVGAQTCATKVTVYQNSPYIVAFSKYAKPAPSKDGDYLDFPTTETKLVASDMYFKGTVSNNATTDALMVPSSATSNDQGLWFRARAYGAYGAYTLYNGGHVSAGGNEYAGAYRRLRVGTTPAVGVESNITIPAKGSKTLYFFAEDLIPYGFTDTISIEVSNDKGLTWASTGMRLCDFRRLP